MRARQGRRAEQGEEVVLTRHGKPAAKIVPAVQNVTVEERRARRRAALEKFHGCLKGEPGFEGIAAERVTDFLYDDRGLPA